MFIGRVLFYLCMIHALLGCTAKSNKASNFTPNDIVTPEPTPPPVIIPPLPTPTPTPEPTPTKPIGIDKDEMKTKARKLLRASLAQSYSLAPHTGDDLEMAKKFADQMYDCGFDANGPRCMGTELQSFAEYFLIDQLIYIHHIASGVGPINHQYLITAKLTDTNNPKINSLEIYRVKNHFVEPVVYSDLQMYHYEGRIDVASDFHDEANDRLTRDLNLAELYQLLALIVERQGATAVVKNRLNSVIHEHREIFKEDDKTHRYALLELFVIVLKSTGLQLEEVAQALYDIEEEDDEDDSKKISSGYLLRANPSDRDFKKWALEGLTHSTWFTRLASVIGLDGVSDLRDKERAQIIGRIDDSNKQVARTAYNSALQFELGSSLTKSLDKLMDSKNEKTRDFTINILGKSSYSKAAGVLVDRLVDDSPVLAARIQGHLEKHSGLENYRRQLIKHFENKDPEIRYLVAKTLPFFNKSYNCKKALQAVEEQLVLEAKIDVFPDTTRKLKTQLEDSKNRLQIKCPN